MRLGYYPPILGYHRIGTACGDHVPTVSPEAFERQLVYLARHRYRVMGLEEVADCLEQRRRIPRRSAVITFDDGYVETYSIALPLLKRFRFPSIVFIAPGEVGWKGFVTWEHVQAMAEQGMSIGSHTIHHSYLPLVPHQRLPEELVDSKRMIEARIDRPVHFISYPIGGFTAEVQSIVKDAGYRAACTTNRRSWVKAIDRFALRRIKMTERDRNLLWFRAKMSGYYDAFRQLEQPD